MKSSSKFSSNPHAPTFDRAGAIIEEGHDFPGELIPIEQAKPSIKAAIAWGIERLPSGLNKTIRSWLI